ncbi:MAG TPA: response regulator [Aggregatilineales bacterium]|nr:response regulator [Aggregatilineales bacterium]
MVDKQFVASLADAYEHIYDLVYLRTHSLLDLLAEDKRAPRKDQAWQLHHLLLGVIGELDPGPHAPAFSREWRRHRLMVMRYVDGLPPQVVADQLSISRRHFYREHENALEAVAEVLMKRFSASTEDLSDDAPQAQTGDESLDRMELLRLEAAQLAQIERRTNIQEVLNGVIALLAHQAQQHRIHINDKMPDETPDAWGDRRLIRQLLLGVLGHLVNITENSAITVDIQVTQSAIVLTLAAMAQPDAHTSDAVSDNAQALLSGFEELAALSGVQLVSLGARLGVTGFEITFPRYESGRTVLVVDDNADILEVLQRYLEANAYHVVTLHSSTDAVEQARLQKPYAIVLDLMMPGQDGWDLLQILLNQPETRMIPIIICSVLRQKELALSLGATAFLEKPISEARLVSILDRLRTDR